MTPSLPRATQIGSRQVVETLRRLAAEVGGLKAFEPGVREAIGNTNWTVLMQRLDEAVAALSRTAQAPVADGVAGELPDDLRAPLHSLEADIDWLVARIRAEDDEVVGVCKESIRNRLSQIEEASYRLSALASSDPTPTAEAGGPAAEVSPETLRQLDALFSRTTQGSWRTYQNGVHPVEVGGMGSDEDYAICTHGPKSFANADWIATMHDEWPRVRATLRQSKPQALPDGYGDYWHSIDTAPEDEHVILATSGDHVGEALMLIDEDTGRQKWTWASGPVSKFHEPLGWRPMPSPIRAPVPSDNRPGGFDGPTGAE